MPTQEITNYINEARKSGLSDQEIRENLLRTGWPENEVSGAFEIPATPTPPNDQATEGKTLVSILAYIGIFVLIPYFSGDAKKDEFIKFHTQQGIVLFIIEVGLFIISAIIPIIGIFSIFFAFGLLILSILGIVNVAKGQKKDLPLVGRYGKKIRI